MVSGLGCEERPHRLPPALENEDAVLVAIAVRAFAALPPSTWRDIECLAREHLDVLEEVVAPAAEHAANRLDDGEGALRDAFGQGSSGATLSGSARVIDGDSRFTPLSRSPAARAPASRTQAARPQKATRRKVPFPLRKCPNAGSARDSQVLSPAIEPCRGPRSTQNPYRLARM